MFLIFCAKKATQFWIVVRKEDMKETSVFLVYLSSKPISKSQKQARSLAKKKAKQQLDWCWCGPTQFQLFFAVCLRSSHWP